MRSIRFIMLLSLAALLAACASGTPRRVSEPAASIQQLTVQADGSWSIELRLQNYSSIPMRFESARFEIKANDQEAGTLAVQPALTIGPESADVINVEFSPSFDARAALADALSSGRGIRYALDGEIQAAPDDRGKARSYKTRRDSQLSPVPGLVGVMR